MFEVQPPVSFATSDTKMLLAIYFLFVFSGLEESFSYRLSNRNSADNHHCWNGIGPDDFHVICYYTDWSSYRQGKGQFRPTDISGAPCTHVIYSFGDLKEDTLDAFVPIDSKKAIQEGFMKQVTNQKNNELKVMLSVGGWGDSKRQYSKMLGDPELRTKVVKQTTEFLIEWNFDGLDVAIDFPKAYRGQLGSSSSEDKTNFVHFLRELRYSFDAKKSTANEEDKLILSIAVSANSRFIDKYYDVASIAEICDWISVMPYNYRGSWNNRTGFMAPFSVQPGDDGPMLEYNFESAMNLWLMKGAPADKLTGGFTSFGHSYVLADERKNTVNSPANGVPKPGAGTLAFYEILDNVLQKGWTSVHMNYLGSYAYQGNLWVGYDDVFDIAAKSFYVKINCFRGVTFWSLDLECFQTDCPTGKYPLIQAASDTLKDKKTLQDFQNIT